MKKAMLIAIAVVLVVLEDGSPADAVSLQMTTDKSNYAVGENIIVTVTGDTAGGVTAISVFLDVDYDDTSLVNGLGAVATQNASITSFGGALPWTKNNPACMANGCVVLAQLAGVMPLPPDPAIIVGTLTIPTVAAGTLTIAPNFVDFFEAPSPPPVVVTISSPCAASPELGCFSGAKALLTLKHNDDEAKDKLIWKWIKGDALDQMDFADPTLSASYLLCVYAGPTNALVASMVLPPGPSWKEIGTKGYKFKGTSPDGLTLALLKGGADGKSKALAKGQGATLPDPTLPLAYPVTVQLKKDGSPLCLESAFTSADEKKNDATQFKAKH